MTSALEEQGKENRVRNRDWTPAVICQPIRRYPGISHLGIAPLPQEQLPRRAHHIFSSESTLRDGMASQAVLSMDIQGRSALKSTTCMHLLYFQVREALIMRHVSPSCNIYTFFYVFHSRAILPDIRPRRRKELPVQHTLPSMASHVLSSSFPQTRREKSICDQIES